MFYEPFDQLPIRPCRPRSRLETIIAGGVLFVKHAIFSRRDIACGSGIGVAAGFVRPDSKKLLGFSFEGADYRVASGKSRITDIFTTLAGEELFIKAGGVFLSPLRSESTDYCRVYEPRADISS